MRHALPMILIRIMMGLIFVLEGLQKILQPGTWGTERFVAIGMPWPQFIAPAVGGIETACGLALILNLYAGEAALILMMVSIGAVVSTRIPILMGQPFGPFHLPPAQPTGWLAFLHESRLDLAMFFSSLAVAIDSGLRAFRQREWYNR